MKRSFCMVSLEELNLACFRDFKGSIYEGGTKVPGFVHYGSDKLNMDSYSNLMHSVDLVPTILSAVHGNSDNLTHGLDGVSHWSQLMNGSQDVPRKYMVYNIDDELVSPIFNVASRHKKFQVKMLLRKNI